MRLTLTWTDADGTEHMRQSDNGWIDLDGIPDNTVVTVTGGQSAYTIRVDRARRGAVSVVEM